MLKEFALKRLKLSKDKYIRNKYKDESAEKQRPYFILNNEFGIY